MRCIECGAAVDSLYTEYAKDNFRLTQCPRCLRFADKYVEFDYVILTIDTMLIKPQVYRHLLFNTLAREDDKLDPSTRRLGILLLLFEVYLTWFRVERTSLASTTTTNLLIDESLMVQYGYFFVYVLLSTLALHVAAISLARVLCNWRKPHMVSTALFLSSCVKLLPVLMVIWNYDSRTAEALVECAMVAYNIEALRILLECGVLTATVIAVLSTLVRLAACALLLRVTRLGSQPYFA
ncbi:Arv1 protein [Protomyces lactucae-debilis]|uniref:Protein ARV n=1 Tax=Protomyces lactucae-debilis TaxID=2754530 RepID=A0A1Y2FGR9_PROLT|nr:Arv1 protein [Protomyces lactucae-debilis]ORY82604.1 Arv1 protein [Protomyces lactucae-debilis]